MSRIGLELVREDSGCVEARRELGLSEGSGKRRQQVLDKQQEQAWGGNQTAHSEVRHVPGAQDALQPREPSRTTKLGVHVGAKTHGDRERASWAAPALRAPGQQKPGQTGHQGAGGGTAQPGSSLG